MDIQFKRVAKRLLLSLLLLAGLAGCVYAPPYAGYGPYYYDYYAQPAYVAPPVSLNLDFGYFDHGGGYYRGGSRGHYRGGYGGYRGGGGYGGYRGGGWGRGRGRR